MPESQSKVMIGRLPRMLMNSLTERERRQVVKAAESLHGLPPERWPEQKAMRLEGEPPLYMLRASQELRVFVRPSGAKGVEIIDIWNAAATRSFEEWKETGARG